MSHRYQLVEEIRNDAGASNKARGDIVKIAQEYQFQPLFIKTQISSNHIIKAINKLVFLIKLLYILSSIEKGSCLLIQLPILNVAKRAHKLICTLKLKHNISIISIIHDINDLRDNISSTNNSSFYDLLKVSDAVISHNEMMTVYLMGKGIDKSKIVDLEIFDYLSNNENKEISYSTCLTIAGNLDTEKVGYIQLIRKINNVDFILYGPNYREQTEATNITYKGVVKSEKLPTILDTGFGLIWDGNSLETCNGPFGEYLRYNNPHKLSLYLASGIPVAIWSHAAESSFVKKYNLGFTFDSLSDIGDVLNGITRKEYMEYVDNVRIIRNMITRGEFARRAIRDAVNKI